MEYRYEFMEITDDFHPTPHHKWSMKRWKTFWQITRKKMLFFSQAGFQVLKRKTSSFCRPAKPKCLFGAYSRKRVKRVERMQSATQNLFICGNNFIQTLERSGLLDRNGLTSQQKGYLTVTLWYIYNVCLWKKDRLVSLIYNTYTGVIQIRHFLPSIHSI